MENLMEEDASMSERILNDIENIFYNDINLEEFCIVPITENKNKSPVLYEEHNLGLESWCVKYVYGYLHRELFKRRHQLRNNRLPQQDMQKLNRLLIGALLIHPDTTTFWNMRREIIQCGEINLDKELLLSKLVLSNKSKSNEAFAYRKWVLNRFIKSINNGEQINFIMVLLNEEFHVTEMAAGKSQNNYHAWSHRIWSMQNIALLNLVESGEYLNVILNELDFSIKWIGKHVSEHSGYHYRQYLCQSILNNANSQTPHDVKYHCYLTPRIGIKFSNYNSFSYLNYLLGKREHSPNINDSRESLKCYNYVYYIIVLLSDLIYFIKTLNDGFPGHESMWCHRRFVLFHLLKIAYEYHGLTWRKNVNFKGFFQNCDNICDTRETYNNAHENGEKHPKLLKYELDRVESSYLYKVLVETESKFVQENSIDGYDHVQRELAQRHKKWLNNVLCFNTT